MLRDRETKQRHATGRRGLRQTDMPRGDVRPAAALTIDYSIALCNGPNRARRAGEKGPAWLAWRRLQAWRTRFLHSTLSMNGTSNPTEAGRQACMRQPGQTQNEAEQAEVEERKWGGMSGGARRRRRRRRRKSGGQRGSVPCLRTKDRCRRSPFPPDVLGPCRGGESCRASRSSRTRCTREVGSPWLGCIKRYVLMLRSRPAWAVTAVDEKSKASGVRGFWTRGGKQQRQRRRHEAAVLTMLSRPCASWAVCMRMSRRSCQ